MQVQKASNTRLEPLGKRSGILYPQILKLAVGTLVAWHLFRARFLTDGPVNERFFVLKDFHITAFVLLF